MVFSIERLIELSKSSQITRLKILSLLQKGSKIKSKWKSFLFSTSLFLSTSLCCHVVWFYNVNKLFSALLVNP